MTAWVPTLRLAIGGETVDPSDSVPVPKLVPSAKNCTWPVGTPGAGTTGATVAVKVTGWPNTDGLTVAVTPVIVEAAGLTVWVIGAEVLGLKLPSPAYVAVTAWVPPARVAIELAVANPSPRGTVWRSAPSTKNDTVPVGPPAPGATGATVAVKVTGWPKVEGLGEDPTVVVVSALPTITPCRASALVV